MQIEALKEAYEELKEMYGENIISAVSTVDHTTPICIVIFVPLTKRGESIGERRDRHKKKMQTQEEFLASRKKGRSRQIASFGAGAAI